MDREQKKLLEKIAKSLEGIDKSLKRIASDNPARSCEYQIPNFDFPSARIKISDINADGKKNLREG